MTSVTVSAPVVPLMSSTFWMSRILVVPAARLSSSIPVPRLIAVEPNSAFSRVSESSLSSSPKMLSITIAEKELVVITNSSGQVAVDVGHTGTPTFYVCAEVDGEIWVCGAVTFSN